MEHSLSDLTAQSQTPWYLIILMTIVLVAMVVCMYVSTWRSEQRMRARRRVWDRLAQEENPEGWARRQARQAQIDALVAAELAEVRRARWYNRLMGWDWR